jgi:S1-C subfamily serine protease
MAKKTFTIVSFAVVLFMLTATCAAQDNTDRIQKQLEPYTLSLELQITRRSTNGLEGVVSLIFGADPNAYATGFLIDDGLVMTAYHVVSGELSDSKKINMGFRPKDQLDVKVFVNGCKATILKVDKEADLALLEICGSRKDMKAALAFQSAPAKDEKLLLIARPQGAKKISKGFFYGTYQLRGQEYWSAKIASRDGFSGSPVYNHNAEVVGVFTGYDWVQDLALISPSVRAQKLLDDYNSSPKTDVHD